MRVDELQAKQGPDVFYTAAFRVVLEDHMTFLRTHPETKSQEIEGFYAAKHKGDFFGLMAHYRVPYELHWVVMRMNNFVSPQDCDETLGGVIIPNVNVVERLRSLHMTQNKSSQ